MKHLVAIVCALFCTACTGDDTRLVDPPDSSSNATTTDSGTDTRIEPIDADEPTDVRPTDDSSTPVDTALPDFWMQLGTFDADGLFVPWESSGDLPVVAGFQGGFHTEHVVRLDPDLSPTEIADALIRVSLVDTTNTELASGSWLFDPTQWTSRLSGHEASVPPVVFGEEPEYDTEVEVLAETELPDGRTAEFSVMMTLVPFEP